MQIDDPQSALHHLSHINYYRLSGYWLPFEVDHSTHTFKAGTNFDTILGIYLFDKKLRLLLLNAIERVEISLRTQWTYHLAHTYGSHAHLDARLFKPKWTKRGNLQSYQDNVDALKKDVKTNRESFVRHFNQFEEELPPLWVVCEIMMLGPLSKWYTNLTNSRDRNAISRVYGLDESNFTSFIHHLTTVRNICAHHARLWNREFTFTFKIPKRDPSDLIQNFDPVNRMYQPRKIYNTLVMLAYLMDVINPKNKWKKRLFGLIEEYSIDVSAMGFPEDYSQRPLWQSEELC